MSKNPKDIECYNCNRRGADPCSYKCYLGLPPKKDDESAIDIRTEEEKREVEKQMDMEELN